MFSPTLANVLATIIAAALTAAAGYLTARLTTKVQQQAASQNAHGGESERAWKRVDGVEGDADHWRAEWAYEFRLRVLIEALILRADNDDLENELKKIKEANPKPSDKKP